MEKKELLSEVAEITAKTLVSTIPVVRPAKGN